MAPKNHRFKLKFAELCVNSWGLESEKSRNFHSRFLSIENNLLAIMDKFSLLQQCINKTWYKWTGNCGASRSNTTYSTCAFKWNIVGKFSFKASKLKQNFITKIFTQNFSLSKLTPWKKPPSAPPNCSAYFNLSFSFLCAVLSIRGTLRGA